jgi:hypothetical protein
MQSFQLGIEGEKREGFDFFVSTIVTEQFQKDVVNHPLLLKDPFPLDGLLVKNPSYSSLMFR